MAFDVAAGIEIGRADSQFRLTTVDGGTRGDEEKCGLVVRRASL
jgi:hypothetical protein